MPKRVLEQPFSDSWKLLFFVPLRSILNLAAAKNDPALVSFVLWLAHNNMVHYHRQHLYIDVVKVDWDVNILGWCN